MSDSKAKHYKLMRDDARPIEFDGVEVAAVQLTDPPHRTRAAVYRTAGGRFVCEYAKLGNYAADGWIPERAKIDHFDTLEAAAEWFRPGLITTMLLAKLHDQLKGEVIE